MSRMLFAFTLVAATPAIAHDGAHLHPHGAESWLALVAVALIAAAGTIAWKNRK